MQGFITERELSEADQVFPGICALFAALVVKPRTFLELVAQYDHWCETQPEPVPTTSSCRCGPGR